MMIDTYHFHVCDMNNINNINTNINVFTKQCP